jgi:diguanylate cyclase (GGDEF)-like protein
MRIVRLAALVGSLILLVATAVSLINRRGDVRDEQVARVEVASTISEQSVRATLSGVADLADVATLAMVGVDTDTDDGVVAARRMAEALARAVPGSDVCVNASPLVCTGADLLAVESVSDLAARSARPVGSDADGETGPVLGVDVAAEMVSVVSRFTDGPRVTTVALHVPVDGLVTDAAKSAFDESDVDVVVAASGRTTIDEFGLVELVDGERTVVDVVGSPFAVGSIEVTSSVDGDVGLAADRAFPYLSLFALGTVLLALAGWTFLVERRQLERRATTDELTGLINRREFERVSVEALDMADRFNTGLCVMVIDLNGFKQINDRLGHQFGDLVLTAASERFVDAVRETDVVARWGGDEFVILLPGLSERTAVRNSAERIWNKLAGSPVVGDITIAASIGAAIFPRHGTTFEALMRAADVAMYEAKATGVSHRIADTIAVGDSLLTPDGVAEPLPSADPDVPEVVTDGYAGPDRRRSPVPPPPVPPRTVRGSDRTAGEPSDLAPPETRHDEPSIR